MDIIVTSTMQILRSIFTSWVYIKNAIVSGQNELSKVICMMAVFFDSLTSWTKYSQKEMLRPLLRPEAVIKARSDQGQIRCKRDIYMY